jgi:hypothetical protein
VLLAVISCTALYSRLEDRVAASQLAAIVHGKPTDTVTGYERERLTAALRRLRARGVINYEAGRGRHATARIGLPETQVASYPCSPSNAGRSRREPQVVSAAKHRTTGGHSEEFSEEELSEESEPLALAIKEERRGERVELVDNLEDRLAARCPKATRHEWDALFAAADETFGARGREFIDARYAAGDLWPSEYREALKSMKPLVTIARAAASLDTSESVYREPHYPEICPDCLMSTLACECRVAS